MAQRILLILFLAAVANGQRTPTISYITDSLTSKIGGTIEMDCSVLYAAEYPVLWVKLPPQTCDLSERGDILTGDYRKAVSHTCTPIPLSSNSALIVRDNRFRFVEFKLKLSFDFPKKFKLR